MDTNVANSMLPPKNKTFCHFRLFNGYLKAEKQKGYLNKKPLKERKQRFRGL